MVDRKSDRLKDRLMKCSKQRTTSIDKIFSDIDDLKEFNKMYDGLKDFFIFGDGISYNLTDGIIRVISVYGTGKIGNCDYCDTEKLLLGVNINQKCFAIECQHIICNKCKKLIWQDWNICDRCKRMFCRRCLEQKWNLFDGYCDYCDKWKHPNCKNCCLSQKVNNNNNNNHNNNCPKIYGLKDTLFYGIASIIKKSGFGILFLEGV